MGHMGLGRGRGVTTVGASLMLHMKQPGRKGHRSSTSQSMPVKAWLMGSHIESCNDILLTFEDRSYLQILQ